MNRLVRHSESEKNNSHPRVLESPLLSFSVKNEIKKLKKRPAWTRGKRNAVTLQESDSLKVVLMSVHKGAVLKDHKADSPVTFYVVSGEIKFTTEEEVITAGTGNMIVLEAPMIHHIEALEESHLILTIIRPK
jgi:quercetin dioxygenase-like cupin family protein